MPRCRYPMTPRRLARWREQETRKRQQDHLLDLSARAERDSRAAQERLAALREVLLRGLRAGKRFDWGVLKRRQPYAPFVFQEPPPSYEQVAQQMRVPARSFLEALFSGMKTTREQREAAARQEFNRRSAEYEARRSQAFRSYEAQRQAYEQEQTAYNASIDEKQRRFQAGEQEAMIWFLQQTLATLTFPEGYGTEHEVAYEPSSGTTVITMQLPNPDEVPRISGYKFIKTRQAIEPTELKPKEFEPLYESLIHQMALLTIHRVFREAATLALQSVVFNGWVTGIDRASGNDFTSCILSVQAPRETFQAMQLERVEPKECIRSLRGLSAGPLAQLAPVRPILELDMADKRFVESREVLASLNATDNLATMDWADFEHLVRELFAKFFGGEGSDVRVTQASRDGGVDAVAFDPDPIRGGKFVIQAKRYNHVVPVSAVRDLYGTMIHEGATKGILVTTSYYGNDAREFVKDKPITLIDGANLVHMFQQYGYQVRIDLQ